MSQRVKSKQRFARSAVKFALGENANLLIHYTVTYGKKIAVRKERQNRKGKVTEIKYGKYQKMWKLY